MSGERTEPAASAAGSRDVDLDKARAARAESQGDPVTVTLGGEQFVLPSEMPMPFVWALEDGDVRAAVQALVGGEQWPAFLATRPSDDDLAELLKQASRAYGVDSGEDEASPSS